MTPDHIQPWKVTASRTRIEDPWFRVRQDDVKLPTGATIDGYYVWESPDIATIVPITPEGQFVLVRQYRHGVGKVLLQAPAGMVDEDESPEQAARRELEEETGYTTAGPLTHLATLAMYPTKLSGWHHIYLARDVTSGGARMLDATEPLEVVLTTSNDLITLLVKGEFQVGDSVAAVLLALRHLGPGTTGPV